MNELIHADIPDFVDLKTKSASQTLRVLFVKFWVNLAQPLEDQLGLTRNFMSWVLTLTLDGEIKIILKWRKITQKTRWVLWFLSRVGTERCFPWRNQRTLYMYILCLFCFLFFLGSMTRCTHMSCQECTSCWINLRGYLLPYHGGISHPFERLSTFYISSGINLQKESLVSLALQNYAVPEHGKWQGRGLQHERPCPRV